MWGQAWGSMIWGNSAVVPAVPPGSMVLLAGCFMLIGVLFAKRRNRTAMLVLVAVGIPLSARALGLPYTFSNGTTADAAQVNANFRSAARRGHAERAGGSGDSHHDDCAHRGKRVAADDSKHLAAGRKMARPRHARRIRRSQHGQWADRMPPQWTGRFQHGPAPDVRRSELLRIDPGLDAAGDQRR